MMNSVLQSAAAMRPTRTSTANSEGTGQKRREGCHGVLCEAKGCPFFFSSRRRHTRCGRDCSSDVCSSDLTVSEQLNNECDINSYIGTIKTCVLASGLIFELPILMYFLGKLGVVTHETLRKYRKIAIVLILIIASVITPPDVVSQIVVSIPLLILYEISIFIVKWVVKKDAAAKADSKK